MEEAERIAREEHGSRKLAVISGIGVRSYYARLGFRLEGPYMTCVHGSSFPGQVLDGRLTQVLTRSQEDARPVRRRGHVLIRSQRRLTSFLSFRLSVVAFLRHVLPPREVSGAQPGGMRDLREMNPVQTRRRLVRS